MRPLIKICGLTRPEDAQLAVELGATHIGVVRVESSRRRVTPGAARDVFAAAEGRAETVLVFRGAPVHRVIAEATSSRARGVQLYDARDEDVEAVAKEGFRVYRVYRIRAGAGSLPVLEPRPTEARPALVDVGGGGSGRSFDWTLLGEQAPDATFIAGGIRPDNVGALLKHRPYGIDLSSGVERAPGVKDPDKLRALFEEVR